MDVSKILPADIPNVRAGATPTANQGPSSADATIPIGVDADIRPLDIAGALQILLAEVRAALDLTLITSSTPNSAQMARDPAQVAREVTEIFLRALPQNPEEVLPQNTSDAATWINAVARVETTIESSIQSALSVVSQWRDVPPAAIEAVQTTQALFLSAVSDDPQNPLWLRPEWLGLAPTFNRLRRWRRVVRRRLIDPDYPFSRLEESEESRR